MAGSILQALELAQAYTWDQSHGYLMGGMGYPDFDCSGFVGRCLNEAGYNYPSTHVGTAYMRSYLLNNGFTELDYNDNFVPQHGDIFVMNHYEEGNDHGHTFFYAENIQGYTDYNANSDHVGNVAHCKIEASSSRGNTNPGDSRKNGTGAYWEVWTHAYYYLVTPYSVDPVNGYYNSDVKIYRDPNAPGSNDYFPLLASLLLFRRK